MKESNIKQEVDISGRVKEGEYTLYTCMGNRTMTPVEIILRRGKVNKEE
jgi:hypothetical protein